MNHDIEAVRQLMAADLPASQTSDAEDIAARKSKAFRAALKRLPATRRQFLGEYGGSDIDTAELEKLSAALASGKYARPSEYVARLDWIWGTFIPESAKAEALSAVDRCLTQPFDFTWSRRSLRSSRMAAYAERIRHVLAAFAQDVLLPYDLASLLTGDVLPEVARYLGSQGWNHRHAALPCRIAGALDRGDEAVCAAVRDILMGDGRATLMREVIQGVAESSRSDMHALLGQLLLAARLQEGLRQVICECADMGTQSAFMTLLAVIAEGDLIRFSAVKRAVGTWLGLITDNSADLERVSGKTVLLVRRCLEEEAFRAECLASQDSMAIHVALWAIGFTDADAAAACAADTALTGTRQQRLACGYFLTALNLSRPASALARQVVAAFPDEADTLAVYLPFLMHSLSGRLWHIGRGKAQLPPLTDYFADEAECRRMIDLLLNIRQGLKKAQVFDPCVFPWYSARLDKGLVAEKLLCAALLTRDDALIDSLLPCLTEAPVDDRDNLLRSLCREPETPARRRALITALCDKGEWVRRCAADLAEDLTLQSDDVPLLEELLRFKYADARPKMMNLLLQQDDDGLLASVARLLADKVEERRIAALDMVSTILKSGKRPLLMERIRPLLDAVEAPGAKEQPLLESIREKLCNKQADKPAPDPLFTTGEAFVPKPIDASGLADAAATWVRYFPDSQLPQELEGKKPGLFKRLLAPKGSTESRDQAQADIASLTKLVLEHHNDTVTNYAGEECLLSSFHDFCRSDLPGGVMLREVWDAWYAVDLGSDPTRLMRACILINTRRAEEWASDVQLLFGTGFHMETLHHEASKTGFQVVFLLIHLVKTHVPAADRHHLALALMSWMVMCAPEKKLWRTVVQRVFGGRETLMPLRSLEAVTIILSGLTYTDEATFPIAFNAVLLLHARMAKARQQIAQAHPEIQDANPYSYTPLAHQVRVGQTLPNIPLLLLASARGHMPRHAIYALLMNGTVDREQGMMHLSLLSSYHRLQGAKPAADRWGSFERMRRELLGLYLGHEEPAGDADAALLAFADEVCQPLLSRIIDAEIRRGDAPSDFTALSAGVTRIDSTESFVRILAALGKDKLVRTGTAYSLHASRASRTESLCALLRCCVPQPGDTADALRALVQRHGVKPARLIEAALYVPAWIELCEEAMQMPGFTSAAYYFIAHMNEDFDDARMARIARFTPLTADELQSGAFDIAWFRSAYEALGEAQFDLLYDAAKYITDGAKHARARKYADAALGRLTPTQVQAEIAEKRNKDLLRAYAVIPLAGETDVQERYLYLQQFLKESRSFGAQRAASEKSAVEIAMQNLAMNAGYADAMRLTLRMETRLTEENAELFAPREVDGVTLRLIVDDQGLAAIECMKAGKALKSIPAKMKKDAYVLRLTEMKKQLTEQHRRARRMLEEAMELSSAFTASEIAALMGNPVISPMLTKLVFMAGERFGFTDGLTLTDASDASTPLLPADVLVIAHPYHLWQEKQWIPWQQRLFEGRIVQPVRQVFRELYVKTADEMPRTTSLRYSGHQLQPKRTLACLKTRRWIADPEAGLQKVFYQENLIATIWALADWFTPADIEAPTLEHVAFLDRKTGKPVPIADVPPVLFSEVMRDVDLAVSVAHAGGVDPECSHSTIEMRAALLAFTLPLFCLDNVVIEGSHALIEGQLAKYSVHLGSGVVHQRGGTMLSVIPVHGQHRGRLFLPFADDDPKTAEIISKVLLFAEDSKLKDPTILEQIIR